MVSVVKWAVPRLHLRAANATRCVLPALRCHTLGQLGGCVVDGRGRHRELHQRDAE